MIGDIPTKAQGVPRAALQASEKPKGAKGRQRAPVGRATAHVMFRCDPSLHDSIKAIAARNGVSMSEAVRLMLTAYVGNDGGRSSDVARLSKSLRPLSGVRGTTLRPRKALP
jgi:Ribbon-helix-helix protein, copG family